MSNYIDQTYIENRLNKTFSSSTSPTDTQLSKWIEVGENNFETEVGIFTEQTDIEEIVKCLHDGLLVSYKPITDISNIYRSDETFDRNFTDHEIESDEFRIENAIRGKIKIKFPRPNVEYKVIYSSGYATESMPENIKDLAFLYVMKEIFKNTLF
ncbi:MAG: hypothetical protein ACQESN_10980, partial [Thermotogota bacterium]